MSLDASEAIDAIPPALALSPYTHRNGTVPSNASASAPTMNRPRLVSAK